MIINDVLPKWSKEIIRFLSVKPQFLLWGNIYDVYPIEISDNIVTLKITDYLKTLLKKEYNKTNDLKKTNQYSLILNYQPISGFSLIEGDNEVFKEITGESFKNPKENLPASLNSAYKIIEKLINNDKVHTAIFLSFSSRLSDLSSNDINEFYYNLFKLSHSSTPKMLEGDIFPKFNLIFWLMDKENDIPPWYIVDNPKIKVLSIPKPDYNLRKNVISNISKTLNDYNSITDLKKEENISLFTDQTNSLHASEILSIVSLAKKENISFNNISSAIKNYKLGILENPWTKLNLEKIKNSENELSKKVIGQKTAIVKSSDILKRAVFNLSGSQYSKFSQRPKGVLFFAGPTGVGKTELAKSIAELIFGSENSYIRFDMSEFSHEHSDQRLIGSPPGYVGYDIGGELTNSIKQNPFSVILFDEIEKANPKILDIFLQILDDGRLSSGRGETVYFSECLIIFTSNLGIYEITMSGEKKQRVDDNMVFEEINQKIIKSIQDFFKFRIGRPEILNRIGENIVVFDFIRQEGAFLIFEKMIQNVLYKIADSYNINIKFSENSWNKIREESCKDLSMGGRGIGNKIEEIFINPLSRILFSLSADSGDTINIIDINKTDNIWNLTAEKFS